MKDNNPSSINEAYGIEVDVQNSSGCIQVALHTREQMVQRRNSCIYNELNGDFTHEPSNEVKRQNQIQCDDKQIITRTRAKMKVQRSNEAAASLNRHLSLDSLPVKVNDSNVHCPEGHL